MPFVPEISSSLGYEDSRHLAQNLKHAKYFDDFSRPLKFLDFDNFDAIRISRVEIMGNYFCKKSIFF